MAFSCNEICTSCRQNTISVFHAMHQINFGRLYSELNNVFLLLNRKDLLMQFYVNDLIDWFR